jgi:hypothetical protein
VTLGRAPREPPPGDTFLTAPGPAARERFRMLQRVERPVRAEGEVRQLGQAGRVRRRRLTGDDPVHARRPRGEREARERRHVVRTCMRYPKPSPLRRPRRALSSAVARIHDPSYEAGRSERRRGSGADDQAHHVRGRACSARVAADGYSWAVLGRPGRDRSDPHRQPLQHAWSVGALSRFRRGLFLDLTVRRRRRRSDQRGGEHRSCPRE